jgi:hypothetical protein
MKSATGDHELVFVGGSHRSVTSPKTSKVGHLSVASIPRVRQGRGSKSEDAQRSLGIAAGTEDVDHSALSRSRHLTDTSPECRPAGANERWWSCTPYWDRSKQVLLESSPRLLRKARCLQALFPGGDFMMVVRH